MTDLQSLLTRLEEAEGPDRRLDLLIFQHVDGATWDEYEQWAGPGGWTCKPLGISRSVTQCPAYTASLDAALALVERVLPIRINDILSEAKSSLGRKHALHIRFWRPENGTYATALARSVCISLLRAKLSEAAALKEADRSGLGEGEQ